ncbi:MAG: 6-bladed beta-propeller [Candidatus Thiodiazotropha sp. (ex Lucinoma borealis)]|nr:6-bladed beta-propeller [Candidatus Thiodiazotropha sp. (ex Lucinoma borealis)]MCU7855472.1 6-bladed beta-propeller [Candidatus Thiodiazotropha sp. (ex Lucinoma borealis)]MCU7868579.1 6-bladed beta-propeller [Candidatus Thiodiazotropha sp. (ex Lucinoma borealis)]
MVWPNAGETPRFSYAGELLGQTNFRVSPDAKESTAVQVLSWLAGLDQGQAQQPVVLQRPQGGAVDADGRIYVSDVSRQAIFVFDPVVGDLHVWEWATESNRFRSPVGIVVRPDGEVLVADSELGQIVRLAPDGRPKGVFASNELQRPTGLALDPASGLLYVADTRANEIKVFTHQGRLQLSFGNPGDGPGQLNAPTYLAVAEDRIYVTDTLNARIQVFDTAGHLQHVIGERGHYIGNLSRPKGIAVSSDGLIYVVESYYDYLLVYDRDGRFLMPIGGPGRKPGEFMLPAGVWLDERGRVYVSDMLNGRVSIFQFLGADT